MSKYISRKTDKFPEQKIPNNLCRYYILKEVKPNCLLLTGGLPPGTLFQRVRYGNEEGTGLNGLRWLSVERVGFRHSAQWGFEIVMWSPIKYKRTFLASECVV